MEATQEGIASIVDSVQGWAKNYVSVEDAITQSMPQTG